MNFSISRDCKLCNGSGKAETEIRSEDIMYMVNHNLYNTGGEVNKIATIKQVRTEYEISLKQAKDLVEGAMLFYSALQKMRDVSIDLPSAPHWTEEREDEQIAW